MTRFAAAPLRGRLTAAAPVIDAACLCAFVLLGRESHGIDEGGGWFFIVVWPFVAGWFGAALALSVYTARRHAWMRVLAAAVIGTAIALVLRVTVTHRDVPPAFVIVAIAFVTLATLGWRVVAVALVRRRSR